MIARMKFWFVAATMGLLPLLALGWVQPGAVAGLPPQATVAGPLELSDKTASVSTTQPGQPIVYQIKVRNSGIDPADGVLVTDTLPAGLTFQNGTLTATSGLAAFTSGVITWTGSVPATGTVSIAFKTTTQADAPDGTIITNTAIISGAGALLERSATTTLEPAKLYLPLVSRIPPQGLQGRVTFNGAPVSGIFLELRNCTSSSCTTQSSTTTDGNGRYIFIGAPGLAPDHFYHVRFLNSGSNSNELWFWQTADIHAYTAGQNASAGDFDLADITMVSPGPGATVGLPYPFQWNRRGATPTDSYLLSLFDPDPSGTAFGQTQPLGYVSSVTLTSVPNAFHTGHTYGWYMAVVTPDGGYGESYWYRTIRFSSLGTLSRLFADSAQTAVPDRRLADRPPQ